MRNGVILYWRLSLAACKPISALPFGGEPLNALVHFVAYHLFDMTQDVEFLYESQDFSES